MSEPLLPAFDDAVLRAMQKWPDVPHCFGWLRLDRRGQWLIQGQVINHPGAVAFLSRNYQVDTHGRWFVQNGPQRVFVELDYTPWIYRFAPSEGFSTHTGLAAGQVANVYADDDGNLLLDAEPGPGLVDDRDLSAVAEFIDTEQGDHTFLLWSGQRWPIQPVIRANVAARSGFVSRPTAD